MQLLRRFFKFITVLTVTNFVVLSVLLLILFLLPEFWSPPLRDRIEALTRQKTGIQLQITRLRAIGLMPLTFRLENLNLNRPDGLIGKIDYVDVGLDFIFVDKAWDRPRIRLGVILAVPQIKLPEVVEDKSTANPQAEITQVIDSIAPQVLATRPPLVDFGFFLTVKNGTVEKATPSGKVALNHLDLDWRLPSLAGTKWNPYLKTKGRLEWISDSGTWSIPLEIVADKVSLNSEKIQYEHIGLQLAGIQLEGKGLHDFISHNDNHTFEILSKDLNEFPPSFLPKGLWQGKFAGDIQVTRQWPEAHKIQFRLTSDSIRGEVQYNEKDLDIVGPVEARLNLRGEIQDHLELEDSSFWIDLTNANIIYSNLLKKPNGTNLSLDIIADTVDTKFNLRRLFVKLAHLRLEATAVGLTSGQWPIEGKVTVPTTRLEGLEAFFPPLAKRKALGDVTLAIDLAGELKKLEEFKINFKQFILRQFTTAVTYPAEKPVVNGQIRGQIELKGQMVGAKFKNLDSSFAVDLTGLEIQHTSGFQKSPKWPIRIDGLTNWDGKTIGVEGLKLKSKAGEILMRGSLTPGQSNEVALNFQLTSINLHELSQLRPIDKVIIGGLLNGKLSAKGKFYSSESLTMAPVLLSGSLDWQGGRIEVDTETPKDKGPVEKALQKGGASDDPLVPNWPILHNANLQLKAQISSASGLGLQAGHIEINGQWQNGQWHGECHVGSIFDGEVKLNRMTISPTIQPMPIEFKGQMSRISLEPLLKWISPKLAGYMKGLMSGPFSAIGELPLNPPNFQQIKAESRIKIENGYFKTFELEKKLASSIDELHIPVKFKPSQGPVSFLAQGSFQLLESQTTLQDFIVSTERRDEVRIRGVIQPNFGLQLSGTAAMASISAQGAIAAANSDGQGRLVLPLQISGNLSNPDFQLANVTAKKMIEKTLQNETEKLGGELKKQLNKLIGR